MTEEVNERAHWASYSSLAQHRTCPQRWNYARVRRLEKVDPLDIAVERDFGSWWHMLRAAESLTRGRILGSLQWVPEELTSVDNGPTLTADGGVATPRDVLKLAVNWWSKQHFTVHEAWEDRLGEGLPDRLVGLYRAWRARWAAQIADERPLAVELKWTRRLPMPEGSEPVELVGYVDEVYLDKRRNVVVARDHKSVKKLSSQSAADDMMDSQLQLYAWGAGPTIDEWGVGKIQATAYDRARMTKPSTPVLTQMGNLSKSEGTDTDLATYLAWAKGPAGDGQLWGKPDEYFVSGKRKGEPKFGTYTAEQSVIERLSTPGAATAWFQRTLVPLSPHLVTTHLQAAMDSAEDIARTRARITANNMAGRNLGNCRWCDFQQLCRAEMFGGANGTYDLAEMGLREKSRND